MNMRRALPFLLFTILVLAGCAGAKRTSTASSSRSQETPSDFNFHVSRFDLDEITYPGIGDFEVPQPKRIEMENGLTVFLLEDRSLPQVNASARVGVGSVWEPADKRGLAGVTGTVMRTGGTASMSPDEVNQALENVGATLETSIGATSGSAFMSTLAEHTDEVLPIFVDILTHPTFASEKVNLAKQQKKSSISRRNDNPQQIAFRELRKLIYGPDSPYARTPEYYTIDRIQPKDLRAFHGEYYHPNNTFLSVWGDFDTEKMTEKIRKAFGDWERADGFERPDLPPVKGDRDPSVNFVSKKDVTQSTVLMGHVGAIQRSNPDYFPVIVMNEILSGGFAGRLMKNVRSDKGLAYAVFGDYSTGYNRNGLFRAGVFSKSSSTVEAAKAVMHEIRKMRQKAPTEDELELAKDSYLNSFVFNFDTRREILNRLMTYAYYDYPADFLQKTEDGVQQVTTEDVFRVAKKYLHPDAADVLVLGNEEKLDEPVSALTNGGSVNEIDITIPTQPPGDADAGESAVSETEKAQGRSKLMSVRQALGGAVFDGIENTTVKAEQIVDSPQGQMSIQSTVTVALPDQIRVEQHLPMGTITIISNGEKAIMRTPRGTQAAPAQVKTKLKNKRWRDLMYLMAHAQADGLTVQAKGEKEVDGQTYQALRIQPPEGKPFTLYINPETMQPARMDYQAMTRQGPKEAYTTYADYRNVDGVMVPYAEVTYQNDKQAAKTNVQDVTINTQLTNDAFEVGS